VPTRRVLFGPARRPTLLVPGNRTPTRQPQARLLRRRRKSRSLAECKPGPTPLLLRPPPLPPKPRRRRRRLRPRAGSRPKRRNSFPRCASTTRRQAPKLPPAPNRARRPPAAALCLGSQAPRARLRAAAAAAAQAAVAQAEAAACGRPRTRRRKLRSSGCGRPATPTGATPWIWRAWASLSPSTSTPSLTMAAAAALAMPVPSRAPTNDHTFLEHTTLAACRYNRVVGFSPSSRAPCRPPHEGREQRQAPQNRAGTGTARSRASEFHISVFYVRQRRGDQDEQSFSAILHSYSPQHKYN
jgi:hypothetical protein